MGKSAPSPPTPPDPAKVAAAQTGTNLATAQAQSNLSNVNQVTPYGNVSYTQNYVPKYDDKGNLINGSGPQWTQTSTLSPGEQKLFDLTQSGQTTYGQTANTLLQNAQGMLSKPISTN